MNLFLPDGFKKLLVVLCLVKFDFGFSLFNGLVGDIIWRLL